MVCVYIITFGFMVFFGISKCVKECVSVSLSVSCAFSWAYLPFMFVLSHFNTFVFVLSYYILCYYFPLEFCLFSNKRQKVDGSAWVEENSEEQRSGKP